MHSIYTPILSILTHPALIALAQDPGIDTVITNLQTSVGKVMLGVGILGILLWAIAQLAAPLLPDWAQGIRGYFQKAMVALVVSGFASTLVNWLYKLSQPV